MAAKDFGIADLLRARARIAAHVHRTPFLHSSALDAVAGARLALKAENLQRTGSFKARGAFNALCAMPAPKRARGVLAVSSGNHAQAVALAARTLGTTVLILMPQGSNPAKVAAARAYGAEIVFADLSSGDRDTPARELAASRELPLVHPFDDWDVMAGQGTAGLELTEQMSPVDAVVVPVGGGGLVSGVATAVKDRWPRTRVVGVEPANADDVRQSLVAGRRVSLPHAPQTIADGVRTVCVGERPWTVISRLVDEVVTVSDHETLEAMELLWTRAKTVVEPSGALPLAAVLAARVHGSSFALVLSGGNVDLDAWAASRR